MCNVHVDTCIHVHPVHVFVYLVETEMYMYSTCTHCTISLVSLVIMIKPSFLHILCPFGAEHALYTCTCISLALGEHVGEALL